MRDALDRDKSLVELRALLASYEERLAKGAGRAPESHASHAHLPEPLFLVNGVALDFRSSALEGCPAIEAPPIIDCFKPEEPEPFSYVYRVTSGVFRVHPRKSILNAAIIGPFPGPPPSGFVATVRTSHGAAPPVRFHMSTWLDELDPGMVSAQLGDDGTEARFLTVPPRHHGFIVATDSPQPSPAAGSGDTPWGLLLATIADPPDEISHAWAEFSDIAMIFPGDGGFEVRLLS